MENPRRLFLNQVAGIAGIAALNKPLASIASVSKHINTIYSGDRAVTIYNTNDLHGKIDAGYNKAGGLQLIKKLLEDQDTSGLLVDAGDFLNSASNTSQHKEMIRTMNSMGYCAATPGNHELALGQESLAALISTMKFAMVNCNYQFDAVLGDLIKPYAIVHTGKFKVGITGVGQPVKGIIYKDAFACANQIARVLKIQENCDLVICLSHLGYKNEGNTPDNKKLARQSEHIDVIISGHNRKIMNAPMVILNKQKEEVMLSQAGWDGMMMGKMVFNFESKQKSGIRAKHFLTDNPSGDEFAASVRAL
ncbi:MAG: metallophosphoesterase, partial [Mucilaginibacter sp.]